MKKGGKGSHTYPNEGQEGNILLNCLGQTFMFFSCAVQPSYPL